MGFRMHHAYGTQNSFSSESMDLSDYPDMQELLLVADVLITDYSSCMWDFSLTGKPCFIYAADSEQYISERDFYTPMASWPFSIALNNEELRQNILNYNEKAYRQKVKKHHERMGICESGHASELVADAIYDYCFNHASKQDLLKRGA